MLSLAVALAISSMLVNLGQESAKDYTFACFFLICTTLLLRLRWLLGTAVLSLPLLLLYGARLGDAAWPNVLPADADVHLIVAWATGALLSYTNEVQKRQMFIAAKGTQSGAKEASQQQGSGIAPACQRRGLITLTT
ncbi:hypothetical protein COCSUDRAFT_64247 [Coccomyxa subellipsoidea C-169]|uniref:Uncharacterized protein n=1 Tax=Coccomyxa subellipsoidea (strain C-169) TaxID=574566 RepID=I0ZA05_COCSC|nr:hypothetical protein COCSUDRAFT_64247 [Coccomyxa subellipsoidea C-169]EIE27474.1 hypothetical protein COCSUDRAFT_64247 [Coccomyxa subellipsoidea C-169]|eukprot:XP_005652018.1 hypothetical protein COCSUDRAFT_64247 [Coccomyxa subellipsoidea C-169]